MLVLNEEKLSLLFKEISEGFIPSPLEITFFIVLICAIIAASILVYRHQKRKSRIEKILQAQRLYEGILKQKALTPTDLDLLDQLALYLKIPDEKNTLIENQYTFNSCAKQLLIEQNIPQNQLATLRQKLGFKRHDPEQIPGASTDLSEGTSVLIVQRGGKKCPGMLVKSDPDALYIEATKGYLSPGSGSSIRVYFQKPTGLFYFPTQVNKSVRGIIKVNHSENIKRLQRRKFYRKKLRMPVYVKHSGAKERPARSTFLDLGGGGASLMNVKNAFNEGDDLLLSFFPMKDMPMTLTASVLRVSNEGKTLHVDFGLIPEPSRDRIIGYLFKKK